MCIWYIKEFLKEEIRFCRSVILKKYYLNGYIRIICGFFYFVCIYNILVVKDINVVL